MRPAGASPAPTHTVRLIDLPDHDTAVEPIRKRLTAHLRRLRARKLLLAYFEDLRERERSQTVGVVLPPLDSRALGRLKSEFRVCWDDQRRTERRAEALAARREQANGIAHLKDKEQKDRLRRLQGEVPAATVASEHRADEIAASLHEEMPWMAPATEAAWGALRRSAREGTPVRFGPMILLGPPGVGKTAWARRLAMRLDLPACMIDASKGLASFSLAGTEKGWATQQPGRPLKAMIEARVANPVVIIDEVCKASSPMTTRGTSAAFLPAMLGLLEPESSRSWDCPYFRVAIDMSHLSWVMTANTLRTLPEPLKSRCLVPHIPDVTPGQLQGFARRQGTAKGFRMRQWRRWPRSSTGRRRPCAPGSACETSTGCWSGPRIWPAVLPGTDGDAEPPAFRVSHRPAEFTACRRCRVMADGGCRTGRDAPHSGGAARPGRSHLSERLGHRARHPPGRLAAVLAAARGLGVPDRVPDALVPAHAGGRVAAEEGCGGPPGLCAGARRRAACGVLAPARSGTAAAGGTGRPCAHPRHRPSLSREGRPCVAQRAISTPIGAISD